MALWRDDPDAAADALIVASLDDLELAGATGRALVVEGGPRLYAALQAQGKVVRVDRRASIAVPMPMPVPPAGDPRDFERAFVRLPKSKDELEFAMHRLMAWMAPSSRIYIYGGNDEGIRSATKRLAGVGVPIETVAAHSHGRILMLRRPLDLAHVKSDDAQWRRMLTIDFGDGGLQPWVSYPGLFAGGTLDSGTALLLDHLPALADGARILDYGSGTGVIARAVCDAHPTAIVTALDADVFALAATQENAPSAKTLLGYRLKDSGRHDLILSNPPIHNGFREDYTALHQMIEEAPKHLLPKGRLLFVVQRRVPVEAQLKAEFESVEIVVDEGPFRIWSASYPVKHTAPNDRKGKAPAAKAPMRYGDIEISDEVEEW